MKGIFTGVGTGPGDPELMTIKAVRIIQKCSVIAVPVSDRELTEPVYEASGEQNIRCRDYLKNCTAYQIALQAVPEAEDKDRLFLPMPMIKEKETLRKIHDKDAAAVARLLDQGRDVIFLTLGDPTVYSTCMYVHQRLKIMGYTTAIVPGIPSFCAAAARLDISLVENRQELHVLPASYKIEESLQLDGTKVLMKAGRKMTEVRRLLMEQSIDAAMVENCGMENERIYLTTEEIPEDPGYYSLLIVKQEKKSVKQKDKKTGSEKQTGGQ